jgi:hypothetical protein
MPDDFIACLEKMFLCIDFKKVASATAFFHGRVVPQSAVP